MRLSPEQKIKLKQHVKNILLIKCGVLLVLGVQYVVPWLQQRLFANSLDMPEAIQSIQHIGSDTGMVMTGVADTGQVTGYQGISITPVSYQGITQSVINHSTSLLLGVMSLRTNQSVSVISGVATSGAVISVSLSGAGFATPLILSSVVSDATGNRSVQLPQPLDPAVIGSEYDIEVTSVIGGVAPLRLIVPSAVVINAMYQQSTTALVSTSM